MPDHFGTLCAKWLSFESCHVAWNGINYYNMVGSSKDAAYKRSRKVSKKTIVVLT